TGLIEKESFSASSPFMDWTDPWDCDEYDDECDHVERANDLEQRSVGEPGVEQAAGGEVHQQAAHYTAEADQSGHRRNDARLEEVRRHHHHERGPRLLAEERETEDHDRPLDRYARDEHDDRHHRRAQAEGELA